MIPKNNRLHNIKALKLVNNEDIMGYIFETKELSEYIINPTENFTYVGAPKKIMYLPSPENPYENKLSLIDWAPYSNSSISIIPKDKIISLFSVDPFYIKFYINNFEDAKYYTSDYCHLKNYLLNYVFNEFEFT